MEQEIGGWEEKKEIEKIQGEFFKLIMEGEEKHTGLHMEERDRNNQANNMPGEKTRKRFTKQKKCKIADCQRYA